MDKKHYEKSKNISYSCQEHKSLRMLFSSFGFESPILCKKFENVIPCDELLKNKTCWILPYAGYDSDRLFEKEKMCLVNYGFFDDKIIYIKDKSDALSIPDYIYVPGGDPYKLIKRLREINIISNIVDNVRNNGTVYIGVSAGADIAAKSIEYVLQLEDNNEITDGNYNALGLINESIVCHYDQRSMMTLKACRDVCKNEIMTINNDQLLMYTDGNWSNL